MIKNFRICQNNLAADSAATLTASSSVVGFGVANVVNIRRDLVLRFSGHFEITTDNCKIPINDGSAATATLTVGSYPTAALLAAEVQAQLNAVSSDWTCAYSTSTFKFTIGRSSGTANLVLSDQTDAAWETLGFVGTSDVAAGTGLEADESRNHTSETIEIDLGAARTVNAFHLLGEARAAFGISEVATVMLRANSIPSFSSPPLEIDLTGKVHDEGVTYYLDAEGDQTFRYWQVEIIDRVNPAGPEFELNYLYLGDYVSPAARNLSVGFERSLTDPSEISRAVSGNRWVRRKTAYWTWTALTVKFISDSDRTELERVLNEMGRTDPFIISLDPAGEVSASPAELTKWMTFGENESRENFRGKYYNIAFTCEEWL